MGDQIEIRRLELETWIGVPEEERAVVQKLWLSVVMEPRGGFEGLGDEIGRTVDYYEVAQELKVLAREKSRCLIETLVVEVADFLMEKYELGRVWVELEKRILPDADWVAVRVERVGG